MPVVAIISIIAATVQALVAGGDWACCIIPGADVFLTSDADGTFRSKEFSGEWKGKDRNPGGASRREAAFALRDEHVEPEYGVLMGDGASDGCRLCKDASHRRRSLLTERGEGKFP